MILLDLLNLTTPEPKFIGSDDCITYSPGNFPQNEYFSVELDGNIKIWAPTKGASTISTSRTRTELREVTAKNTTYNWMYNTFNDHWLTQQISHPLMRVAVQFSINWKSRTIFDF